MTGEVSRREAVRTWMRAPAPFRDGLALFGLSLGVRGIVCAWAAGRFPPAEDGHFYHIVATRIARGLGYTWLWPDGAVTYAAHYPIGYPALVGVLYAAFGPDPVVAMVFNACVGALGVLAVHRIAASAAGRAGALLAAVVAMLHPALVFYTPALMTEGVAGTLVVLGGWLSLARSAALSHRPTLRTVLVGLSSGVATLVRPQLILLSPLFGALAASRRGLWRAAASAVLCTVVALAVCAPWTVRNCARLERCVFVSANSGWNLLIGAGKGATGSWVPLDRIGVPPECRDVFGEADKDVCFRRAAVSIIENDWLRWIGLMPAKLAVTFDYGGAPGWYLHSSNGTLFDDEDKFELGVVETLVQRLVLLAALVALARAPGPARRFRFVGAAVLGATAFVRPAWLAYVGSVPLALALGRRLPVHGPAAIAAATIAATAVTHAVFFGAGRYSLVCYPALAALAGCALTPLASAGDTEGT